MNEFEYRVKLVDDYLTKLNLSSEITDYYKGRNILVTGGAGAIGSNLVTVLSKLVGDEGMIIVLDNLSAIKGDDPIDLPRLSNMMFVNGDVRNDIDLKRVFREKPTIVYHLAAFFANQNSVDYPENSADVDIQGMIKLLDLAQFTGVERFVYASSGCAIYGSYGEMPLKEDFISMHLTTPYQINKMAGEMYSNFYFHHYGLKTVNCRFFNSFGPGEVPGAAAEQRPDAGQDATIGGGCRGPAHKRGGGGGRAGGGEVQQPRGREERVDGRCEAHVSPAAALPAHVPRAGPQLCNSRSTRQGTPTARRRTRWWSSER